MSRPTVDELLDVVDDAIAAALRAGGWEPDGSAPGEWVDPASGHSYQTTTALAMLRRDARR